MLKKGILLVLILFVLCSCQKEDNDNHSIQNNAPSVIENVVDRKSTINNDKDQISESCAENSYASNKNTVKIYFRCTELDIYPLSVKPVLRDMTKEETLKNQVIFAIQQVLKGPTHEEIEKGFSSTFKDDTSDMLKEIKWQENGHLIVNFTDFSKIVPNASTSTGSSYMMASLNSTISQFKEVQTIEYQFDGSCESFYEWIQVGPCMDYIADNYRTENEGLKDDHKLNKSELHLTVNDVVDFEYLERKNAELRVAEYMSYEKYLKLFADSLNTSGGISPDRKMLVIQVYYPNGYKHPKAGFMKNCLATGIYDVETKEYLGGTFESLSSEK
ncbi:hypothetical protein E3U55_04480 [Filobacillus milosensis]|uniref:GerMN domain-containing protein n=1 Tax=Filobacillus milosensis TaxID=94137 RepID=A0A4Y8IQZ1_9BACI|nr:GerMN domain-containing protein [Filobacillus milosensis]TFB24074.1 hypothetical protein E3U55_04480 [Filobacillus milosensis]